jgi:hypothetical protein
MLSWRLYRRLYRRLAPMSTGLPKSSFTVVPFSDDNSEAVPEAVPEINRLT